MRTIDVPELLRRKLDAFGRAGHLHRAHRDLFADPSWLQVMVGQGLRPKAYHPFAGLRPEADVAAYVAHVEQVIAKCVKVMPTQADFIAKHCAATPP